MPPLYLCCEPPVGQAVSLPLDPGRLAACPTGEQSVAAVEYRTTGYWYRQIEYFREMERGLDFREDLFNPGILRFGLRDGETVAVRHLETRATLHALLRQAATCATLEAFRDALRRRRQ